MAALGLLAIVVVDTIDGLMLALTGWFLTGAARQVDRRALLDELLLDVNVADVMDREVQSVPPGLTLDTFAAQVLDGSSTPSLPVVRGHELLGIVGAAQLRRVRRDRWPETRAEQAMVSAPSLPVVRPETPLRSAFEDLRRSGLDGLPVVEAGGLAGIVTRRAIVEALRAKAQLRGVVLS
jgi:CBS domain-containing protein